MKKTVSRSIAFLVSCLLLSGCSETGLWSVSNSEESSVSSTVLSTYTVSEPLVSLPDILSEADVQSTDIQSVNTQSTGTSVEELSSTASPAQSSAASHNTSAAASSQPVSTAASSVSTVSQTSSTETSAADSVPLEQVSSEPLTSTPPAVQNQEMRGVWVSYYELENITDYEAYCTRIDGMFDAIAAQGLNTIFFHVRPMSDALYRSELFPFSHVIGFQLGGKPVQGVDPGYDPLAYAVKAAHARGLQLHAWINPYRVWTQSGNADELSEKNPAKIWLTDEEAENDSWVCVWENKLYYNPGIPAVRRLIIGGVRELVSGYDIDGIHFDDYFYPTDDISFDRCAYEEYTASGGKLSLGDWRRDNVNTLIKEVYQTVKELRDIPFGISPSANIKRDREELFADVALWARTAGYVDYLCPQIYFGFMHKTMPFEGTLDDWMELVGCPEVAVYIGLPVYKLGAVDTYAGTDSARKEFITQKKIISRMVSTLREREAAGFVLYSYRSMTDEANAAEMEALRELLQ